jgi:hypothetical protein
MIILIIDFLYHLGVDVNNGDGPDVSQRRLIVFNNFQIMKIVFFKLA